MTALPVPRPQRIRDAVGQFLQVIFWAAFSGIAARRALFTWRTWLFGWFVRVLAQVLFFVLLGTLLGSVQAAHWIFVGNVAAIVMMESLGTGVEVAEERRNGTLPLLVAAPMSPVGALTGKALPHLVEAIAVGSVVFFLLAPVLDFPVQYPEHLLIVPLLAVVALGSYGLGMFGASLLFRAVDLGNIAFNLFLWGIVAIGGVNVTVEFFPEPVQAVAHVLPLTNGLHAIRGVLGQEEVSVLTYVGRELAVGLGWFLLALPSFRWLAEGGRRDGTLDRIG